MTLYQRIVRVIRTKLAEDVPTNAVGGGAVAAVGVGPQGEPPGKSVMKMMRRKRVNTNATQ